jgi:hypothetical protein
MAETEKGLFGYDKNPSNILPRKLTLDSTIQFRCHPGVSCFTACCGNIDIILTPFDILRLRRYLNLPASEFLLRFTTPIYIQKTDMPGVKLHLDENGRCPFVTEAGCTIYPERPSACRYYPVGMANFHEGGEEGIDSERFFFLVKEPHCKGHEEDKHWTIREWRADQGVDLCDEMNREWLEIVMRRKSFGFQATLSEQAKQIFFMVSTDLDKFRDFIFSSSFLDIYEIEQETLDRIREDDIALLRFSYKYLASSLFGTKDLKIREEKIKAKVEQLKAKRGNKEEEAIRTYEELKAERDRMLAERQAKK